MGDRFFKLCRNRGEHEEFIEYAKENLFKGKPFVKTLNNRFNTYPCYIGLRPSRVWEYNGEGFGDGWMQIHGGDDWYSTRGYELIDTEQEQKDAVFVCFKTDDQFLMIRRKDGSWGFPGGKVEGGETHQKAASREVKEEIGVSFHYRDMKASCSHRVNPSMTSHLFVKNVDKGFLLSCLISSVSGVASHSHETTGAALFNIKDFSTEGMTFAPTVLEELREVLSI